jgi:hypothetical protein
MARLRCAGGKIDGGDIEPAIGQAARRPAGAGGKIHDLLAMARLQPVDTMLDRVANTTADLVVAMAARRPDRRRTRIMGANGVILFLEGIRHLALSSLSRCFYFVFPIKPAFPVASPCMACPALPDCADYGGAWLKPSWKKALDSLHVAAPARSGPRNMPFHGSPRMNVI